ncbi:hypothetical protein [Sandaracinus amylolyticus]|uniref:Lipoprotein n=1 Tax=Sandaracinus amylolyticus TaxID=927083 RepID=A0A0F6YHW4_9BACT|nr:hypothetical protein [Sandaracinus amylolyticus]AKF04457.1 hypothetical protein DB32_001606 [Sandaracinus amylolyticus]
MGILARVVVCALACAALGGCESEPSRTELVVIVDSDMSALDHVEIDVDVAGQSVVRETVELGASPLPITFGLVSSSGRDRIVRVEVTGLDGGSPRVHAVRRTRFVSGESRILSIVLEEACADRVPCEGNLTCRAGQCADDFVDPDELPRYTGALPDAGITRDDAGPPDAGPSDAGCVDDPGNVGRPDGCVLDRWPARPVCRGDTGDDGVVRYVALLDPLLDQGPDAWRTLGHDLDGLCTDPLMTDTVECRTTTGPVLDGLGGIDNATSRVLAGTRILWPTWLADAQAFARERMRQGEVVPIMRIRGWSGEPDDARVEVWVAGSVDVLHADTPAPDGGVLEEDPSRPDPAWDGTDRAYVADGYFSVSDIGMPLIGDDDAYVAGGTLVARIPDRAPFDVAARSAGGVARMVLTDARFVGALAADGTRFDHAMVVGRWGRNDLLGYLEDVGICSSDPDFAPLRVAIEQALDLRSDPSSTGPDLACDATSIALPFDTTVPVHFGGLVRGEFAPTGCP